MTFKAPLLFVLFLLPQISLGNCADLFKLLVKKKNILEVSPEYNFRKEIEQLEKAGNFFRKLKENPERAQNLNVWRKMSILNDYLLNGGRSPNEGEWKTFFREFEANFISYERSTKVIHLIEQSKVTKITLTKQLKGLGLPVAYIDFIYTRYIETGSVNKLKAALKSEVNNSLEKLGSNFYEYKMIRSHLEGLLDKEECHETCRTMVISLLENLGVQSEKEKIMFKVFFQGGKRLPIETIEKTLLKEPTFVKARIKKDLKAEFIGFLGSIISQPEFVDTIIGYFYKSKIFGKKRGIKFFKIIYDSQARHFYLPKINRLKEGPKEAFKAMDLLQNLNAPIPNDELLITFARLVDRFSENKWNSILEHAKVEDPDFYQRMIKAKEFAKARGDLSATNTRNEIGTIVALTLAGIPLITYFNLDELPTNIEDIIFKESPNSKDPENTIEKHEANEMINEAIDIIIEKNGKSPTL